MVNVAAVGFNEVVKGKLVHIAHWFAFKRFIRIVYGKKHGAVKRLKCLYLNIFNLNAFIWTKHNNALLRHAPRNPLVSNVLRTYKGCIWAVTRYYSSRCLVEVVGVRVRYTQNVDVTHSKRVDNKRLITAIWLKITHAAHAHHLVSLFHVARANGLFTSLVPHVDNYIGAMIRFNPHAHVTKPPH